MKVPLQKSEAIPLKLQGGGGGGAATMYRLKQVLGDYLIVSLIPVGSPDVYVAKVHELRTSIATDNFDGTVVAYSYTSATQRTAQAGSNASIQIVVPPYVVGRYIWAIPCDHTGVTVNNVELTLIELNQGRAWSRQYDL